MTQFIFAQPANDDCANPQNITVSASNNSYVFDINTANLNTEEGCSGTTAEYADVWFEFTMPFNGNLYVDGSIGWNNFALYNTCGSTQIQCGSTNELIENLTSGANYLLRIFRTANNASNTGFQNFSIIGFEEVQNDDCANSENIILSETSSTINFEIGGANANNEEGCIGTTDDYFDIWYDFTMPFNGNLYIDGSIGWNNFAVYDACNGTQIQCNSANLFIEELTQSTNYKLRLFRTLANADNLGFRSFSIVAYQTATNNDCASAQNITVTTNATTVNFETAGAIINNEIGCSGSASADYTDVWYDFTMPVNGNLFIDGGISWNNFALYDTCGGNEIQCGNADEFIQGLTAGTNYKLRVFRTVQLTTNSGFKSFSIQAFEQVLNDDCASAENITVTTNATTINFEIAGAVVNNDVGCSGSAAVEYTDLWYDFTMPVNGNLFIDGAISWNNFALYDACGGNEIQCGNADEFIQGLTAGTNYKLRLFRTLALTDNPGFKSFTIQAFEVINNDDCASAEVINVLSNTSTTVNFGIAGANINNEVGCSGTTPENYADVWYEFSMPENGAIIIDGAIDWNNFAIYDACSGTELGCFSNSGNVSNLTTGITYKLRVFRTLALADNNSFKSFSIVADKTLTTPESELGNSIVLYPNPTKGMLNISSETSVDSILVFNILGKIVAKTTNNNQVDLSELQTGIYIVKVTSKNKTVFRRIILE